MIDAPGAIDLSCRIATIGVLVGALEQWRVRSQFWPGGLFADVSARTKPGWRTLDQPSTVTFLVAGQVLAGFSVLIWGISTWPGWSALVVLAGAFLLLRRYRRVGGDGAEQMAAIVLVSAVLACPPLAGGLRVDLATAFVGAQAVLAYATSGIAKLASPVWRNGTGIVGILSTVDHGTPVLGRLLSQWHWLALALSWGTIGFECAFLLVLLSPPALVVAFLVLGLIFHLSCAVLMGLNGFIWSFPATYPCVWMLAAFIREWLQAG